MSFLSILFTLLIEQARPLSPRNAVHRWYVRYLNSLGNHFNAGEQDQGMVAWLLAVLPWVLVCAALHYFLLDISIAAAWVWNVAVLYLTMGFRQFSHYFTETLRALAKEDLAAARAVLGDWRGESAAEFSATEIARVSIEQGLLASHRHVFGTVAWFIVLGPAGAVLFRASEMLAGKWSAPGPGGGDFGRFAARLFFWLDWVPARLTALTFAVVGNFEDAIYCWRSQALAWSTHTQGVILAAGGGALGVRLGDTLHQHGGLQFRPELGTGNEAGVDAMEGTIRLIWRSLVLWMFLLFLVSLAHALGG
jgi:adenosylcobinamide-phosphate synthase